MHIALLSKRSPGCGVVTYTRSLETHWRGLGHRIDLHHFATDTDRQSGDHALPYWFKSQPYTWPAPGATSRLHAALAATRPDLIHAHLTISPLDFWLPRVARDLGIPVVATFHTGWDDRPTRFGLGARALYRLYSPALARYDRVIVFGSAQHQAFLDRGVPAERLAIIPNGIDAETYAPGPSPDRLDGRLRVTYMGRMTPDKQVSALVESFVAADRPELVLTLVGAGPLVEPLQKRFAGHPGLDWRGFVADESARQAIWRGSDVVVLPSALEGLSLSLLEGMASGCMPLATDVGAHRDVLTGVGRILDPRRTRRDLAASWSWLAANAAEVPRLGRLARERVLACYTLNSHWRRLEALYLDLCASRATLGGSRQPTSLT